MAPVMRRVIAVGAISGLVASLWVFVASFFGLTIDKLAMKFVYLPLGIFLLLALLAVADGRNGLTQLCRGKPRWAVRSIQVVGVVYLLIFVSFLAMSHMASPEIVNGAYVLDDHGKIIGYISENRYLMLKAWELRMFASFWIFFYFVIAMHCWFPQQNEWRASMPEKRADP